MGEVGQDVVSSASQGSGQGSQFRDAAGDLGVEGVDDPGEFGVPCLFLGVVVSGDDCLIDTPNTCQGCVSGIGYDRVDFQGGFAFEEPVTGQEQTPGLEQQVAFAAAAPRGFLLESLAALGDLR
mgnify:CR=1 FL=1